MNETEASQVKGIRPTPSGKFEVTINHPSLDGGKVTRNFDDRIAAATYKVNRLAELRGGVKLPELKKAPRNSVQLSVILRHYQNADNVKIAYSDKANLNWLQSRISITLAQMTTSWVDGWVRQMKSDDRSSPGTIRKKVESLARAVDWWYRREYQDGNPPGNPLRTLPRGYSAYHGAEVAEGQETPRDHRRDRRLHPGENETIEAVIMGEKRDDKERAWSVDGDRPEFLMLYRVIVNTGLRLREAYRMKVADIRYTLRTIHVAKSKTGATREVPMTRLLEGWLREFVGDRPGEDLVFPYWNGVDDHKILEEATARLSSRFTTCFAYAKCEGLTEHDLRHEATCRWMNKRDQSGRWMFRPEEVRRITGHKSVQMFERYLSLRGSDLAERLD